jgi:nucleoside diphosphate kinase
MDLYNDKASNPFIQDLITFITSDLVLGIELVRENAISVLHQIMV